jgi:hypothetical protein
LFSFIAIAVEATKPIMIAGVVYSGIVVGVGVGWLEVDWSSATLTDMSALTCSDRVSIL